MTILITNAIQKKMLIKQIFIFILQLIHLFKQLNEIRKLLLLWIAGKNYNKFFLNFFLRKMQRNVREMTRALCKRRSICGSDIVRWYSVIVSYLYTKCSSDITIDYVVIIKAYIHCFNNNIVYCLSRLLLTIWIYYKAFIQYYSYAM